jgi:hypothetical protein
MQCLNYNLVCQVTSKAAARTLLYHAFGHFRAQGEKITRSHHEGWIRKRRPCRQRRRTLLQTLQRQLQWLLQRQRRPRQRQPMLQVLISVAEGWRNG